MLRPANSVTNTMIVISRCIFGACLYIHTPPTLPYLDINSNVQLGQPQPLVIRTVTCYIFKIFHEEQRARSVYVDIIVGLWQTFYHLFCIIFLS